MIRYTERSLNEISLGGLLVAVVLRTIQFNMTRMRDKYLHTNCLAALANMSSQFQNLHNYVTQRIVSLFHLLARKHAKTLDLIQQQSSASDSNEAIQDLTIIEDVMRMVLEIINSCLTHALRHNINLIYTLLYNRDTFDSFRTHPSFQDILQNIDTVREQGDVRLSSMALPRLDHHLLRGESRKAGTSFDGVCEGSLGNGRQTIPIGPPEGKSRAVGLSRLHTVRVFSSRNFPI